MQTPTFHRSWATIIITFLLVSFLPDTALGQAWYSVSWPYRKAITIDHTRVGAGPHTNFPVLINITDANLQALAQASGNDILFTSSDGITKLAHEIESYTSVSGTLIAWVRIPSLSSAANTVIYMYYGNPAAPSQQDITGTWDVNFRGVYHLNNNFNDATSNGYNGINTGTSNVAGQIANGRGYVADNRITVTGLMGNPGNITLSAWVNLSSLSSAASEIISLGDHIALRLDNNNSPLDIVNFYYTGATWNNTLGIYGVSGWHYIAATFDDEGNNQRNYVDGVLVTPASGGTYVPSISYAGLGTNTVIGNHGNGGANFTFLGTLDEVRVAGTPRSAGWLLTEFNNQNSPSTFYSVASQVAYKIFTGIGNFSNPSRWTNGNLPAAGDNLIIDGTCTVDNNAGTDNVAYGTLTIGTATGRTLNWAAGGTNRLNVSNVSAGSGVSTLDMTNGGTLIIRGTWTSTNLTFTPGTGTIELQSTLTLPAAYPTYSNLRVNNASTTVTTGVNTVVNGTLTLTAGNFAVGGNTLTLNGSTIAGTPANFVTTAASSLVFGGTTAGVLIPTSVTALSGLSITNTSIVSLQSSPTINGTFNPAGAGLSIGANTLTLNGQINCGSLTGGASSNIIIGGAGAANLSAVTLNNLTINRAVTMCGNVTVGGTLTLTSGAMSIGANTLTLSNASTLSYGTGSLTGGATSNLTIGTGANITLNAISGGLNNFNTSRNVTLGAGLTVYGTLSLTAGALSIGANTLTLPNAANLSYGGGSLTGGTTSNLTIGTGSNITLNAISGGLYNLNSSRNITLGAGLSINGTLTLTAGTFTVGANTLTLNGPTIAGTPGNLTTAATSSLSFGGYSAGVLIPGSVTNLNNLTINNANGVTMNSNITLAAGGVLTLTSGIVQAGTNILKITNTNPASGLVWSPGAFVNVTTGGIERTLTSNLVGSGNNYSFPVGEGGILKAINLIDVNTGSTGPVLKASVSASGALTGDGISMGVVDPRYWSLINLNGGNLTSAKVELFENGLNFSKTIGMSLAVAGNYAAIGGSSISSSVISPSVLNPGPYFCIGTVLSDYYYSFQPGDWNSPLTWTSDPSGTQQVGNTVPGINDMVVILTGRTVSLSTDISTSGLDITIEAGGFLDQADKKFTNALSALRGQGTLRLASVNFPATIINTFIDAGGGTTEYYNAGSFTLSASQPTYNNLTINTSGFDATQLSNLTLNGNLYIKSGIFRINDNISTTKLTLTINGNVTVDNGAFIAVGNGVTNTAIGGTGGTAPFLNYYLNFHSIIIKGNFINNGTVKFTNLPYPIYNAFPPTTPGATSGAASVYFQGASDNILDCHGITNFYNLIIDKGIDQTFKLTITSSEYSYFKLYGANILETDGAVTSNPNLRKALWIRNGTLILRERVIIPSLSEGTAGTSDYYIPSNAALIVDGIDVVVLSTADDYREINTAYTVSAPDNATIGVATGGISALDLFGKLQINEGYLSTRESGGIITSSIASGQVIINDGTIDTKQFLSSTGTASYTQAGGLFILRGRLKRTPASYSSVADISDFSATSLNTSRAINGINPAFGTFNLENTGNIYSVSGGTIRIYDVAGTGAGEQEAFDVKSSSANINVTNGTLEIIPVTGSGLPDAVNYSLFTNADVGNLVINRSSSTSVVRLSTPMVVQKDFSLISGNFLANNFDLTIGGNFTIENGTTYIAGTNLTILNGAAVQTFTINLAMPLSLYKFTIDKPAGVIVNLAGSQNTLTVTDNFRLVLGTLNDNGKTINIAKDVYNSGLCQGTGKIVLNGTLVQSIDGNGIFGNVGLNNTNGAVAPVSLASNMTINGVLTFSQDKIFNIGNYNLRLNALSYIVNGSATRYIQTAGNAGDGGLTKVYTSPAAFTFPVGAPTITPSRPVKYTPATIGFSTPPAVYGSITVIPVGYEHPSTTSNGQSLTYFWRVISSGFSGIAANSVTHSFTYDQSDVVGTESNYVPALYTINDFTWRSGTNSNPPIDITNNLITDWTNPTNSTNFLDADYTAGVASFGTPLTFYSRANSAWNLNTTWSYTSGGPAVPAGAVEGVNFPGPNSIVLIENNHNVNLTANHSAASLRIEAGSTLDIYTWTGSVFSMVLSYPNGNNGLFRLTTTVGSPKVFSFPANSDFSDFNNNNGTTEFYDIDGTVGALYILPANVSNYGNLILSARGGDNLVLPNNSNTTIKGDLTITGNNPDAWTTMSWRTTGVYSPVVEKTVHVTGNMFINNGTFLFLDDEAPQHLIVDGNVTIAAGAVFDVYNGYPVNNGTNPRFNSFEIGGSFINNSNLNPSARFITTNNYVNLSFTGNTNSSITSTGGAVPVTIFKNVTVNKGTSQGTTLTCNLAGTLTTPADNWLTLINGTFIYSRTGNLNISKGTDFTIPATAGLTINTPSNVLIANNASNNKTLFLNGKLTILNGGGNVYIGPIGNTANNADIEYSGGGASAIEIQGGNLFVNGQIRRPVASTNGILSYKQSGGNVIIYGNNSSLTKAKLEVLNDGSEFTMSGGTLTIVRGGGTTFGDLYLRPAVSQVTGGTVFFTQSPVAGPVIDAVQTYMADVNVPMNNLTITGKTAGTARNATVSLMISPLVLNGSLTISNNRSFFNSNNLNVSLKGDLNNNGAYAYGNNVTHFNGTTQSVTGTSVTDFYDLGVSPSNSLTVNNSFTVNRNLIINTGNLVLAANRLTLLGNLSNNGTYTDNNLNSGIALAGTLQQQIAGTGSYGRLELNNAAGAILMNDIILQNNLELTKGVLDINKCLLTLGLNSLINGAPFGTTKMIKTNGVISDMGVRKFFTASPQSFTFPIGVAGKYTPAIYSISANGSVGYINVKPANSYHPSITDPLKVLNYYWLIESSGITGFNANVLLQYMPGDVFGIESDYVAAKLVKPGNFWYEAPYDPATDNVDETNNQITFSFSGSNSLNGEYTAGDNTVIPGEIPTYNSNRDGNWADETIWTPVGLSPPCQPGGPIGSNVIIDHVVTIDVNRINSYSTTINNRLRFPRTTYGHSYGFVYGNGTLYLEEGNLPAGNYTTFTDCSGNGTLEYGGIGNYTVTIVASLFSSLPNMFFTGSGTRVMPSKNLTICKRFVIDGPTVDNSVNKRKIIILGSMEIYNTGIFNCGSGKPPDATVSFSGTSVQTLGGSTGNFSGVNKFHNLEINNPAGLIIGANGLVEVDNKLLLTKGIITTSSTSRLILLNTSQDIVTPEGGKSNSFINGPLTKQVVNGGTFLYPIGKGATKGHNFTLKSGAGITLPWTAEYFTPNPTSTSLTPPLIAANKTEFWSVSTNTAAEAKVIIGWDAMSDLTPLMTENGLKDLRVAEYISGSWNELKSKTSGDNNIGIVETEDNVVTSTTPVNFTIGSVTPLKARASFSSSSPVCGSAGIPVTFTSYNPINLNYTLSYTINSVLQPVVNITSLPYTLPTPVPGAYELTAFTYNNGLNTEVVTNTEVNVYADPPVANAGSDQSLCGVSGTILAGTNPAPYSGQWTVVSGSGGTFVNSTQYNSVFTGLLNESYILRWTISNVSCTSADEVAISFPVVASTPGYFTSSSTPVCQGSGGYVYTVPNVSGNTYNWSYSGTGHTINGTGNSVTIDFGTNATSGTLGVTATNACGTSAARTVDITVTPLPVASFSYAGTPYCQFETNPSPTFSGGGVAGTFSSTPGLVFVSTATGQVDLAASTPDSYMVTNTIAAAGGCGVVTASSPVTILEGLVWTGDNGTDWNDPGNWTCGLIPNMTGLARIPNVSNKPVLSSGSVGTVNDITIESGSSLTISDNTLQISGAIINNGTFDASDGTIIMNGSSAQTIGSSVFSSNTVKNLTINNSSGVNLLGPLNVTGIVSIQNGALASDGYLTLVSSPSGTALIDGTGAGSVTGNVTMQRYLPSAYSYKYISSPFQNAIVNELSDDINLADFFPPLFRYDESRTASGWVDYITITDPLNPLEGYAAHFGSSALPLTADITGVVNNGPLSVTLYNHNNPYTLGYNLVGNPYPSPIDWDAIPGWTKINIDDALYYFKASTTDEYGGTYSTYINGISSDGQASEIIPSMQGFFVHVTAGAYPVTGTLGLNNSVRVTDFTTSYMKSGEKDQPPFLRIAAAFEDNPLSTDPLTFYYDEKAGPAFDSHLDALKLINTDYSVPNLYAFTAEGKELSINALPETEDTLRIIPLGLRTNIDGNIVFKLIDDELSTRDIFITDLDKGIQISLVGNSGYKVFLKSGEYNDRFYLNLTRTESEIPEPPEEPDLFSVYSSKGMVKVRINTDVTGSGRFSLISLTGQRLFAREISDPDFKEYYPGLLDGIYIASFASSTHVFSKKIFIHDR